MQGASPLASPRLNPRGTGSLCRCGKLNGGLPRRCRLGECQRHPAGGRRGAVACRPCRCGVRRGACLLCRPPTLPLACFSAPIPPAPFPSGEGGDFRLFLCKGLRPLHPQGWTGRSTGCPCRTGTRRLNPGAPEQGAAYHALAGGLAPALPADLAVSVPGGGAAVEGAALPCL